MSDVDTMEITPLGAGCEVGRSCCIVRYRGSTIMFDCGLHPAFTGLASLPFFDEVDLSSIDLLLVTHFHMDHCGAVPYLTEKTNFRGRVFMTHPTKAIFKILQHDAVKVGQEEGRLFDEKDMLAAMDKIELINYHQTLEHKGVRFTCYNAGHVLGAAMFQIEVAGVRVLYTGDFSREEDRHLLGAEIPTEAPHVLIVESTYGVSLHEPQAVREQRFTSAIHQIVARGGRCLIPVFALGRSQELLLILDEYWKAHPELHDVPIYYASKVAKKSMRVYQTYINMMNEHIRSAHAAGTNPWDFTHVRNLDFGRGGATALSGFDDSRPMVVMASPGMMQSGFSRELFESWCSDKRNGLMMPGYSVAGTLAHHVMSEPKEITTAAGDRVPVNLSIHYISFSAHSDYAQTSSFIKALSPAHVVLVHGSEDQMSSLQRELVRQFDPKQTDVLMPKNCQSVHLPFRGDKVARVLGKLAEPGPSAGAPLSGLLLKRDFKYTLMAAGDLPDSTSLSACSVLQRPTFKYTGPLDALLEAIGTLFAVNPDAPPAEAPPAADAVIAAEAGEGGAASSSSVAGEATGAAADAAADGAPGGAAGGAAGGPAEGVSYWRVHDELQLRHDTRAEHVVLSWPSGPLNDMLADAVAATILQLQSRYLGDGHTTSAEQRQRQQPPPQQQPQQQPAPPKEAASAASGESADTPIATGPPAALAVLAAPAVRPNGERRAQVLRVLRAHFGEVAKLAGDESSGGPPPEAHAGAVPPTDSAAVKGEAGEGAKPEGRPLGAEDAGTGTWQLMACGHSVTLHAAAAAAESDVAAAPFDRLVCDDPEARQRVLRVIELARGATAPIAL